jgi:hypothetical protein
MPLSDSKILSRTGTAVTSSVVKSVTTKFQKLNHGGMTITSSVEEMPLLNSRKPVHGGITSTSDTPAALWPWVRLSL